MKDEKLSTADQIKILNIIGFEQELNSIYQLDVKKVLNCPVKFKYVHFDMKDVENRSLEAFLVSVLGSIRCAKEGVESCSFTFYHKFEDLTGEK